MYSHDPRHRAAAVCNLFFIRKFESDGASPEPALFPIAGLLPGYLLALIAWACVFLFGKFPGGVAAAVACPLLFEAATGWRGLAELASFLERRFKGKDLAESLAVSGSETGKDPQSVILFASIYLLRMLAFGMLAGYASACWIVFALGGAWLVRGEVASVGTGGLAPLLEKEENRGFLPYLILAAGCVPPAILSFDFRAFGGLLIALAATALLAAGFRHLVSVTLGAANMRVVHILGYSAETLLLFIGLIVFGG